MARQQYTAQEVTSMLEYDDDEPVMQGSDDEFVLCEEGIQT